MVDLLITLKWILKEPLDRSRKYVLYGIGQAKLELEHRTIQLEEDNVDPSDDPLIDANERWLESQRFPFLTIVDVGNWSGLSVRQMATEADCKYLLDYAYSPFSACVHNMWHHVSRYNLIPCKSELHRHHNLPWLELGAPDLDYFYRSAKYVERAFEFSETAAGVEPPAVTALAWLEDELESLDTPVPEHNGERRDEDGSNPAG